MLPGFTADASLGRATRHYRTVAAGSASADDGTVVVPAYIPGPATQARCNDCLTGCAETLALCSATAAAPLAACLFPPACAAAAAVAGGLLAACDLDSVRCIARCNVTRCCPKSCGPTNPFEPGSGCCDSGETCVSESDPHARRGCCPAGRPVCGGDCCAEGDRCCGAGCCPSDWHCIDNVCQQYPSFGPYTPATPGTVTPVPASGACDPGFFRCRDTCCENGMTCCGSGCTWGSCVN